MWTEQNTGGTKSNTHCNLTGKNKAAAAYLLDRYSFFSSCGKAEAGFESKGNCSETEKCVFVKTKEGNPPSRMLAAQLSYTKIPLESHMFSDTKPHRIERLQYVKPAMK